MSKTQIVAIVLLIIGTASFGYLAYGKWQKSRILYGFAGDVQEVSGNKLVVNVRFPTQNAKSAYELREITINVNSSTQITKRVGSQPTTPAKLSDIKDGTTTVSASQINVSTYADPRQHSELTATAIEITKDYVALPPGVKPLPAITKH